MNKLLEITVKLIVLFLKFAFVLFKIAVVLVVGVALIFLSENTCNSSGSHEQNIFTPDIPNQPGGNPSGM
jgi:hypothetical protein